MSNKYTLDEQDSPVVEHDVLKWAQWFEESDRIVCVETIGDTRIETVFLGIDYNFSGSGSPILWETMVFGGEMDQEQERCRGLREQAKAMHRAMVERAKSLDQRPRKAPKGGE